MNIGQIQRLFEERITYKPGWKFIVGPAFRADQIEIRLVSAPVMDAYRPDPDKLNPLVQIQYVHPEYIKTEDSCKYLAEAMIRRLEVHEATEWLRLDGHHLTDPHPERRVNKRVA